MTPTATVIAMAQDARRREAMISAGAFKILRTHLKRLVAGEISREHPLATLDLTTARELSQLALEGALDNAAANGGGR